MDDPGHDIVTQHARLAELQDINARLQRRIAGIAEASARADERARLYAERALAYAERLRAAEVHETNSYALRQALDLAHAQLAAVYDSTSWRVTAPLRGLGRVIARRPPASRAPPSPILPPSADALAPEPQAKRPARDKPAEFPLPGDIAAHPALLAGPAPPLLASVSVVIPTWNAGPQLDWLLRKLRAQRGLRAVEIIVVDSGSQDGTPEVAAQHGCRVLSIDRAAFSHSEARNLGASVAAGDLLLFTVQDAYPIGDDWLAGLVRALLHPAREQDRVAALSCVEFCTAGSEMIYDAMARAHYEFLGCAESDRIGRLTTLDQDALRRQGQLSDVACLIPRALFEQFLFRGRYAEDLTLGIRLIQAGHALAMLSSIRVAHAHHRPAGYYVRRVFVDVVFLTDVFPDFTFPPGHDPVGALMAGFALSNMVPRFEPDPTTVPARMLERVIDRLRDAALPPIGITPPDGADFGLPALRHWTADLLQHRAAIGRALTPAERRGAETMRATVVARLVTLHHYIAEAWPVADAAAAAELDAAVAKTLAMSLGAELAFSFVADAKRGGGDRLLLALKPLLLDGI